MGKESKIQWTGTTWNIAVGCTKVDEDCKYCYMYRESLNGSRFNPMQIRKTQPATFNLPLKVKAPSKIFACSYTDFFHPEIDSYRHEAWDIIRKCPQHTFQILTKRPDRIAQCLPSDWGSGYKNVWLGTSCGSQDSIYRIEQLISVPAHIRFLSLEPLHGEIDLFIGNMHDFMVNDFGIDWIIVGGESGNEIGKYRYRECKIEWLEKIVDQCKTAGIPVFVKQMGTHLSKKMKLSDRHGGNMEEWPKHLQIREFPNLNK